MQQLAVFAARHAKLVVALAFLMAAALVAKAPVPIFNGWDSTLLAPDDSAVVNYHKFTKAFGATAPALVVGWQGPDFFSRAAVADLAELHGQIAAIAGVQSVASLWSWARQKAVDLGAERPGTRQRVEKATWHGEPLLGPDGKSSYIYIDMLPDAGARHRREVLAMVRDVLRTHEQEGSKFRLRGLAADEAEVEHHWRWDGGTYLLTASLLCLFAMAVIFGALGSAAAGVVHAIFVSVVVGGLYCVSGASLQLTMALLPYLSLTMALGNALPMLCRYRRLQRSGVTVNIMPPTAGEIVVPLLLSLVCMAGLALAPLPALAHLGRWGLIAALVAAVSAVGVLPALLALWGESGGGLPLGVRLSTVTTALGRWSLAHRRWVFGVAGMALAVGAVGVGRLGFGVQGTLVRSLLAPSAEGIGDSAAFLPGEAVVKVLRGEQDFRQTEVLSRLAALQQAMQGQGERVFPRTYSVLDVGYENPTPTTTTAAGARSLDQAISSLIPDELHAWVSRDFKVARLRFARPAPGLATDRSFVGLLHGQAAAVLGPDLALQPAAQTLLASRAADLGLRSLVRVAVVILIGLAVCVGLVLRRRGAGLLVYAGLVGAMFVVLGGVGFSTWGLDGLTAAPCAAVGALLASLSVAPWLLDERWQAKGRRASAGVNGVALDALAVAAVLAVASATLGVGGLGLAQALSWIGPLLALTAAGAQVFLQAANAEQQVAAPTQVLGDGARSTTAVAADAELETTTAA